MTRFQILRRMVTLCAGGLAVSAGAEAAAVDPASFQAIGKIDPRFQSYNVEMAEVIGGRFWAPYVSVRAAATPQDTAPIVEIPRDMFRQREPLDTKGKRLRNLAKALGPAYVRVSGSWANSAFFQDNDNPPLEKPPAGFQGVLTRAQWAGLVDFAKAVDAKIVTSFPVSAGTRDAAGTWNPDQARKLIRFTHDIGGDIYAAELVNEPNVGSASGLPKTYDAPTFAHDISAFRDLARTDAPHLKTVGPGSSGEAGIPLFPGQGIATDALMSAEPKPQFDIFSYHFYGSRSRRCAAMDTKARIEPAGMLTEEWLARTDKTFDFYKALHDRYTPNTPIWITETAEASCGGDPWAASFLDTFRYVDQMGRLAKRGVAVVFHNTLAASDYALIDDVTLIPRPSYWAAVLWRRIMGDTVLDAGQTGTGVHVYAHCLRGHSGGVGIVAINLDQSQTATLDLTGSAERYTLSADDLAGVSVKLNGRALALSGDQLPALKAAHIAKGSTQLPPASITFLAVPSAGNRACR